VGRAYPTLEAVQLLRPAALAVGALGWYASSGDALDMMLGDRVVMPPDLAPAGSGLLLPPSFQINFLPLLQPDVSVADLAAASPAKSDPSSRAHDRDSAAAVLAFRAALVSVTDDGREGSAGMPTVEEAGRQAPGRVLVWLVAARAALAAA
jgi:hypothetical protein